MSVIRRPAMLTHNIPDHQYCQSRQEPADHMLLRAKAVQSALEDGWRRTMDDIQANDREFACISSMNIPQPQKAMKMHEMSQSFNRYTRFLRTKTKPNMFVKHAMIGKGGFATVFLVTDKRDRELYAMKVIPKTKIIENGLVPNISNERQILSTVESEHIVKMYASFQDQKNVYFLLEYLPGGDLKRLMQNVGFSEKHVQFVIGELILALEDLQRHNIIHLDLKPGNILITNDGHFKLTDFGVSIMNGQDSSTKATINDIILKQRNKIARRIVTPEYMAPELARKEEITFKADLWSLGVIMFEMIYGTVPFTTDVIAEIIHGNRDLHRFLVFPSNHLVSRSAILLMSSLLQPASLRPNIDEIKKHKFFKGFNFENPNMNIPPLIPSISAPLDLSHFSIEHPVDFEEDDGEIENSEWAKLAFLGFTYRKRPDSVPSTKEV